VLVRKFGPPEVLKVEEVPIPKPGSHEVLVRVHAAGVNPVETYIRLGAYSKAPELPYTPGTDSAGVIEAIGPDVTKFKVGDRVFTTARNVKSGTYAEYCISGDNSCWILPDRLTFAQGAAIGIPYFTAYRSLFQKIHPRPSDSLLVHGASGAVGLAAVQLGRAFGMTVYGTAGTDAGLKLVKDSGAHHVFNHRNPEYTNELLRITGGQGVDVIMEMLANVNLNKDLELLNQFGTVVIIGARGNAEISPRLMMGKDTTVVGMHLGFGTKDQRDWDDMATALRAGFENGTLNPIIDREYPLEKAPDAHRDIMESSGAKGNLVLTTSQHL